MVTMVTDLTCLFERVGMLQEHGHSSVYNIREWERILIYV